MLRPLDPNITRDGMVNQVVANVPRTLSRQVGLEYATSHSEQLH